MNIESTNNVKARINCLVYSESGWGKTYMIRTATNPFIISSEGGLLSLADQDIDCVNITTRSDIVKVYEWLSKSKEAEKYDWVCVDSLSEIAEVLLYDEMKVNKDTRAAYGVMDMELSTVIRGFRDLNKHTYFTCKLRRIEDQATGAVTFCPGVPGQSLLAKIPYFFDEVLVGRYGKHEGGIYRYLQTSGDRQYIAKDRSGKLDAQAKPDLSLLLGTIGGKATKTKTSKATKTKTN